MNNNFYLNIPSALDDNLVLWKGKKFKHFYVKCGEAISQTVEERTHEEGVNTKGLETLYQFYLPLNKIRNAYNSPTMKDHFDTKIFGQQKIKTVFNQTIFSCFESKKIDCLKQNSNNRYGREYIDIADDFNIWLANNPDDVKQIKLHPDAIMIYTIARCYLNEMMPIYLTKFAHNILNYQIVPENFIFRDYQKKVYDLMIKKIINDCMKITAELPPRWGKTKTMLKLFADCNDIKLLVILSYVKSVNTSYKSAVCRTNFGCKMRFVDINNPNDEKLKDDIKTVVVLNTTGDNDKCFKNRLNNLKMIIKKCHLKQSEIMYVNEEADFGNHTEKTRLKLNELGNLNDSLVISVTGTDAYKVDNVFSDASHIVVNLNDWNEIRDIGVNR